MYRIRDPRSGILKKLFRIRILDPGGKKHQISDLQQWPYSSDGTHRFSEVNIACFIDQPLQDLIFKIFFSFWIFECDILVGWRRWGGWGHWRGRGGGGGRWELCAVVRIRKFSSDLVTRLSTSGFFSSSINTPKAPDSCSKISNFVLNSRRYSRIPYGMC
jgi:hypothetical protein